MTSKLDDLRLRLAEVSDLGRARALLDWDQRTQMPAAGAEIRAEQLATLARIRHERLVSDDLGAALEAAAGDVEGLPYESTDASLVRVARREWEKARRVPADLRAEITRAASLAEHAWAEFRERSDFAGFLPYLERNVELRRSYAECFEGFDGFEHPYDPLLDDFEPGMTTEEVRRRPRRASRRRSPARRRGREPSGFRGRLLPTRRLPGLDAGGARARSGRSLCRSSRTRGASTPPSIRSRPRSPRRTSASRPGSTPRTSGQPCGR